MADFDLNDEVRQAIAEAGIREYPKEACGLIVTVGRKQRVFSCRNVAEDPRSNFIVDPLDYSVAADAGEVVAVWHTHPDAASAPSDADRAGCEGSELPWLIVGVSRANGDFSVSEPCLLEPQGFVMPYLGRPYVDGVFDCYSLVRDWFLRERGIVLPDFPRRHIDGTHISNLIGQLYEQAGFVRVDGDVPQVGDLFIMQINARGPNHLAVYLGDDQILHHAYRRLSSRAVYGGGYWQKHTVIHARHPEVAC